ncbi:uncharacterized protein [Procambarus clarkii]|uniref:uncharacterized protein n=1 Tax=Procambarus clarkii TaxID=6728 RepID=UPI0037431F44
MAFHFSFYDVFNKTIREAVREVQFHTNCLPFFIDPIQTGSRVHRDPVWATDKLLRQSLLLVKGEESTEQYSRRDSTNDLNTKTIVMGSLDLKVLVCVFHREADWRPLHPRHQPLRLHHLQVHDTAAWYKSGSSYNRFQQCPRPRAGTGELLGGPASGTVDKGRGARRRPHNHLPHPQLLPGPRQQQETSPQLFPKISCSCCKDFKCLLCPGGRVLRDDSSVSRRSGLGPGSGSRSTPRTLSSNNWENRNNEAEWSPWSKEPARRWSLSPGNLRERREGWAPWKGASPRQSPQELPKQQKAPSPYEARQYYDERYHGRVAPQYDPYFYQERGSGIGPHRPAPRWVQKNQYEQAGRPRQYRGPRPYRSPLQSEEPAAQIEESRETPTRTPTGSKFHPSLPRTPYWPPEGPKRDPLSPGARDNVFSPVTPRRRSSRWNPY